jgi:Na+-transporting NADH:ubiquinone oxidoreductase subunit D
MLLLSPSAFFIIGLFIWAIRSWKTEQVEAVEYEIAPNLQYREAI